MQEREPIDSAVYDPLAFVRIRQKQLAGGRPTGMLGRDVPFEIQGAEAADIDVLVIGSPDRDQLDEAAQTAGSMLAREVNVTVRSPGWWRSGGDGFHVEVTSRPLITVFPEDVQQ